MPLIKFKEKQTQIHFDLSFNIEDGVKQVEVVKKAIAIFPELKHLLILMKCFLRQRNLHETYQGGIGSFLLFCMILAFLREFRKEYIRKDKKHLIKDILMS